MPKKKVLFLSNIYWNFFNFRKELILDLLKNKNLEIFLLAKNDNYKKFFFKKKKN